MVEMDLLFLCQMWRSLEGIGGSLDVVDCVDLPDGLVVVGHGLSMWIEFVVCALTHIRHNLLEISGEMTVVARSQIKKRKVVP